MKLAVLGTGDVGHALATGLAQHGHPVTVGTRDPSKQPDWLGDLPLATFADAAAAADAVVLAVGWGGVPAVLEAIAPHVAGKLLIDVTNPLQFNDDGPPGLAVSGDDSGGETVQRTVPDALVVKCWNIVGNPYMVDPVGSGLAAPPTMFIAGNDAESKATATELLRTVGWADTVDLGGIDASRYLEAMCMAWVRVWAATGSGDHAFALVRKS